MIRWKLDTCYCIIICERPSVNGTWEKRCSIHKTTLNTTTVYDHNLRNRIKPTEQTGTGKDQRETPAGEKRKSDLRETTRP